MSRGATTGRERAGRTELAKGGPAISRSITQRGGEFVT